MILSTGNSESKDTGDISIITGDAFHEHRVLPYGYTSSGGGVAGSINVTAGMGQVLGGNLTLSAGASTGYLGQDYNKKDHQTGGSVAIQSGESWASNSGTVTIATANAGLKGGDSGTLVIRTGTAVKGEAGFIGKSLILRICLALRSDASCHHINASTNVAHLSRSSVSRQLWFRVLLKGVREET